MRKVGIAGAGKMATDIFRHLIQYDCELALWTPFPEELAAARKSLTRRLERKAKKEGTTGAKARARLEQMSFSTEMDVLCDADMVIEAIIEILHTKQKVFAEMDNIVKPEAILVTNTSSLSPTSMSTATSRQDRFAGLHFFYPVSLVSFVEVIPTKKTSQRTTDVLMEFVREIGRRPILVRKEVNGFVVNRLLAAFYNEGANLVGEGYWIPSQIDRIARRFAALGPCESVDHIGVDVILHGADSADESWGQKDHIKKTNRGHEPMPAMYYRLREDGRFGRKRGAGFYRYEEGEPVDDIDYLKEACPKCSDYRRCPAFDEDMVKKRLFYSLVLESAWSLERGIGSKEDIENALKEILGLEQGPFEFVDKVGVDQVRATCLELETKIGIRFAPTGFLKK